MAKIRKLTGQEFFGSEIAGKDQAEALRTVAEILERADRYLALESLSFCTCEGNDEVAVAVFSGLKAESEEQLVDFLASLRL